MRSAHISQIGSVLAPEGEGINVFDVDRGVHIRLTPDDFAEIDEITDDDILETIARKAEVLKKPKDK